MCTVLKLARLKVTEIYRQTAKCPITGTWVEWRLYMEQRQLDRLDESPQLVLISTITVVKLKTHRPSVKTAARLVTFSK